MRNSPSVEALLVGILGNLPATQLLKISTTVSVSAALTMASIKLTAWIYTDSLSVLSSLAESGVHTLAALLNFVAIRYALRPPSRHYRFGHGKAESLAGLLRALFVAALALLIVWEAIENMFDPVPVANADLGIGFMLLIVVILCTVVGFQQFVARRTGSTAIGADALQYKTDVLINLGVILSLTMSSGSGWARIDPLVAISIALYILCGVWPLARRAFHQLMDGELPDDERTAVRRIAENHPTVTHVRELRTRATGIGRFIQLSLITGRGHSLTVVHQTALEIEKWIRQAYPNTEVFVSHDRAAKRARRKTAE